MPFNDTVIQFSTSFISNSLKIWFFGVKLAKNAFVLTRNLRKICDCLFLNPSQLKSSCLALRSAEPFPRSQKSLRTAERTFRSPYFRFIVASRRNIRQFTGVGPNIHEGSKFSVNILNGGSIFWGGQNFSWHRARSLYRCTVHSLMYKVSRCKRAHKLVTELPVFLKLLSKNS